MTANFAHRGQSTLLVEDKLTKSLNRPLFQKSFNLLEQALKQLDIGYLINAENLNRNAVLLVAEHVIDLIHRFQISGILNHFPLLLLQGLDGFDVGEADDVSFWELYG